MYFLIQRLSRFARLRLHGWRLPLTVAERLKEGTAPLNAATLPGRR